MPIHFKEYKFQQRNTVSALLLCSNAQYINRAVGLGQLATYMGSIQYFVGPMIEVIFSYIF